MNVEIVSDPDCAEPELLITLVHGTWPRGFLPKRSRRGPCWFERGSEFVNLLESSLRANQSFDNTRIYAFYWSGENSFFERNNAAAALASILAQEQRDFPKARQTIIAHSHGGNVALRALYYLSSDSNPVDIATVAAPFVEVRLLSWFTHFEPEMVWLVGHETMRTHEFRIKHAWLYSMYASGGKKALQRARRLRLASRLTHLTRLHSTSLKRLFILRAIDHEASLVLAAGAIVTRLSNTTAKLVTILVCFTLVAPILLISDRHVFGFWSGMLGIFSTACLLSLLFSFAPGLFCTVYGREAMSVNCEVNSQSVPDVVDVQTKVITLPQRHRRWKRRHMLYDAPECANLIVSWICDGPVVQIH